jgi:hypothetical protein
VQNLTSFDEGLVQSARKGLVQSMGGGDSEKDLRIRCRIPLKSTKWISIKVLENDGLRKWEE